MPKKSADKGRGDESFDGCIEWAEIVVYLKEDESKMSGMILKQLPALLQETLQNLDEDIKEIDEQYKELLALPTETPSIQILSNI